MRSITRHLLGGMLILGMAGHGAAQEPAPPRVETQPAGPLAPAADWRARIRQEYDPGRSVEQQVARLTRDLQLTPEQQATVRRLARAHGEKIQEILEDAPPALSYAAFRSQVEAVSQDYHDAVSAILTPPQLALASAMSERLDQGSEADVRPRRPPR